MYFEVNSDSDLIDKDYYPDLISRYNKARDKDLKHCKHEKWTKQCAICKRIITSESTDETWKDLHELQHDYERLEKIIVGFIYGN